MSIIEKLEKFIIKVFKTTVEVFYEALKLSPNAQGYISGSITEYLLKKKLEELRFEVKRIREKWEGKKHVNHHGDFYFKKMQAKEWYVLESKGIKSNSEKWHKLYNKDKLKNILFNNSDKIAWIDKAKKVESQIDEWINANLPRFNSDFKDTLYDYEEVQKYLKNKPARETNKSKAIDKLKDFTREQVSALINERLSYLMSKVKVLETHFVSGKSGSNEMTQATPRKEEFNIISVDIFLRWPEHEFLFANPKHLESSGSDPNHLQQNYIIGFVFSMEKELVLNLSEEWCDDFNNVFEELTTDDSVNEADMQIDDRNVVYSEAIDDTSDA